MAYFIIHSARFQHSAAGSLATVTVPSLSAGPLPAGQELTP